jgi:hypothetical protein
VNNRCHNHKSFTSETLTGKAGVQDFIIQGLFQKAEGVFMSIASMVEGVMEIISIQTQKGNRT